MARNKIGVGADGSHNAFARKGEPTLAIHHTKRSGTWMARRTGTRRLTGHPAGAVVNGRTVRRAGAVDIQPRQGAPKRMHPVSIHNGMTRQQIDAAGIGGQGHATAVVDGGEKLPTSKAAAPLAHAYGGGIPKVRPAAQVVAAHPGTRSRVNDLVGGGDVVNGVSVNASRNARVGVDHALGESILQQARAFDGRATNKGNES